MDPREHSESGQRGAAETGDRRSGNHRGVWLLAVVAFLIALLAFLAFWFGPPLFRRLWGPSATRTTATHVQPRTARLSPAASIEELKEESRQVAAQLRQAFPNEADALDILAKVQLSLGNRQEAIAAWQKCAAIDAADAGVYWKAIGTVQATAGDHESAVESYRRAFEVRGTDLELPVQLADSLMKVGRVDEAAAALESHLRVGPATSAALTALGQAYLQLKQYDKAKPTFEAAISANPRDKTAFYGLSMTCNRLGQREEAGKYMEQFRKLDAEQLSQLREGIRTFSDQPTSRQMTQRTLIDAARCYRRHQQPDKAEDLLLNAAALSPSDVESRTELLALYAESARDAEALEVAEELSRIEPERGDHWMNIGVLSARLGDLVGGEAALRKAIKLDPGNARYRDVYQTIREGR